MNNPPMRSKLFVSGSRPELFAKAMASAADAICLDLEDAVAEPRKAAARDSVREFLVDEKQPDATKTLIVRVNAADTAHFERDVLAVVRPGLQLINLPKPANATQVRGVVDIIERARLANKVESPVGILLNIEAPHALRTAAELAGAHRSVVGLQLGLGDLFEPLAISRQSQSAIQQAMFSMRVAAGEAGLYAYDGAFANIRDLDGFRAEAMLSRGLGYLGKSCIHPSQIAVANEVFSPTPDEIKHAMAVLDAARDAEAIGLGAWVVDGKMIDAPFVARARMIVALAGRLALLPG